MKDDELILDYFIKVLGWWIKWSVLVKILMMWVLLWKFLDFKKKFNYVIVFIEGFKDLDFMTVLWIEWVIACLWDCDKE